MNAMIEVTSLAESKADINMIESAKTQQKFQL